MSRRGASALLSAQLGSMVLHRQGITEMAATAKQRKDDAAAPMQDADSAESGNDRGESASSIGRVFAILGAIGDSGQIGISELSQRLAMFQSTADRGVPTPK